MYRIISWKSEICIPGPQADISRTVWHVLVLDGNDGDCHDSDDGDDILFPTAGSGDERGAVLRVFQRSGSRLDSDRIGNAGHL